MEGLSQHFNLLLKCNHGGVFIEIYFYINSIVAKIWIHSHIFIKQTFEGNNYKQKF